MKKVFIGLAVVAALAVGAVVASGRGQVLLAPSEHTTDQRGLVLPPAEGPLMAPTENTHNRGSAPAPALQAAFHWDSGG